MRCMCGCGQETIGGKKYIHWHHRHSQVSEETREAIRRNINMDKIKKIGK